MVPGILRSANGEIVEASKEEQDGLYTSIDLYVAPGDPQFATAHYAGSESFARFATSRTTLNGEYRRHDLPPGTYSLRYGPDQQVIAVEVRAWHLTVVRLDGPWPDLVPFVPGSGEAITTEISAE